VCISEEGEKRNLSPAHSLMPMLCFCCLCRLADKVLPDRFHTPWQGKVRPVLPAEGHVEHCAHITAGPA
jgi:hypothetical protein